MNSALPKDIAFAGRDRFIAAIDAAVALGNGHAVTTALRQTMRTLIRDPAIRLPDSVYAPLDDHYARRELHRSTRYGYSVVAMTWGPNQGTPVHDHSGFWCVEGVWAGELEVTRYELLDIDEDNARVRFRIAERMRAGPGSAGSLIPPHEYHTISNTSREQIAVSIHVYQAPLESCNRFLPLDAGDWYACVPTSLATD